MSLTHTLLALPAWLVVMLVALLPALEASTMLGIVVPGETAVLAAGVLAHAGVVPLWVVIVAAVAGGAAGDQVGYTLGRRYGPRLLSHLPARLRESGSIDQALALLRRRGVFAVVVGRWAATLRALVPAVAGMSGLQRRQFTIANLAGGALWAPTVAVAGYFAGASLSTLERRVGLGGEALVAVVVLLAVAWLLHRRRDIQQQKTNHGCGSGAGRDDAAA